MSSFIHFEARLARVRSDALCHATIAAQLADISQLPVVEFWQGLYVAQLPDQQRTHHVLGYRREQQQLWLPVSAYEWLAPRLSESIETTVTTSWVLLQLQAVLLPEAVQIEIGLGGAT